MKKVKVYVTLKESIIDPQGSATKDTVNKIGYTAIEDVRVGRLIELTIADQAQDVEAIVKEMCEKVLVNTIMENYRFEIEEA